MNRFWTLLFDARVLGVIGLVALAAFLFLGADVLKLGLIWVALALALALVIWGVVWVVRKLRARRAARALEQGIEEQAAHAANTAPSTKRAEINVLRGRLTEAVKTIRGSKLGERTGSAALYELPWYLVIGSPAAGKSTAIVKSGLNFPFADDVGQIVQGIGGTRNCDWFFTSEGILLDTAGRYAVHEEDRQEWLGFLGLLKRYRPKAPINGIIIAASAAELASARPEQAITLAKNLRQRVQELTENLEVFAPVYVLFTKADLISGFAEFFEDSERSERERVWGATLPYERRQPLAEGDPGKAGNDKRGADTPGRADLLSLFDQRFDELTDGLKEMSVARMGMQRGQTLPPGVLTFPLEFAGLKPALRAFVATLFEDNAFQFQPVFRGFYFTSAVQEGTSTSRASERVAQQFALRSAAGERTTAMVQSEHGFFLRDLFSKVIFADRELVRQYASRRKQRARGLAFGLGVAVLAVALGGWSWSWLGNRQLTQSVQADLDKAVKLQAERSDLASRMEALELLQDRIEQLARWKEERPLGVSLGLYQGEQIERRLREEYFAGIKLVMLQPVAQTIETYLAEVNRDPARLKPMLRAPESGAARAEGAASAPAAKAGARFVDASPEDSADAYNALKTYLMLGERERLEAGHLNDQITRYWRGWLDDNRGTMPRELLMRSAERLISFTTSNLNDPAFPLVGNQLALVDSTRQNLRDVARGMRGVERVYADVKTRAATRFPPITVAGLMTEADKGVLAGSHAVPGPFTREAWDGYIEQAFKDAASNDTQNTDWVLKVSSGSDLTLEGSPEQIRKQLTELYKTEYVAEWRKFMQGVAIAEFGSFDVAVERMNRLGDVQNSPIRKLLQLLFDQTSWDNPSLLNERLANTQKGALNWFKQTILRQAPSRVDVNINLTAGQAAIPLGPIGREFAPLARIMMSRDNTVAPINDYLAALGKVRTRFNQIRTQGDPGPGARTLMAQTLEGGNSELAETLRLVDERMLNGLTPTAREALRPLLVRPLQQGMAALVPAAETELNRQWAAQVYEPFQRTLAPKYPFDASSRVEATAGDIAKLLGPTGAVAKFGGEALGPLVNNRGNVIEPRTWGDVGIRLKPEFASGYAGWVATMELGTPGGGSSGGGGGPGGGANAPGGASPAVLTDDQRVFEILPLGSPGIAEYTLTIDGQTLRYRNTAPQWTRMVYPNHGAVASVRLQAITQDGQALEFVNASGLNRLDRLLDAAKLEAAKKKEDGRLLTWTSGNQQVQVNLRLVSAPGPVAPARAGTPGTPAGTPATPALSGTAALRGLKLPATAAGSDAPPGMPTTAATPVSTTTAPGSAPRASATQAAASAVTGAAAAQGVRR